MSAGLADLLSFIQFDTNPQKVRHGQLVLDRYNKKYRIIVPGAAEKFSGPSAFCDYLSNLRDS